MANCHSKQENAGNVAGEGWVLAGRENSGCYFITECVQVTEKEGFQFLFKGGRGEIPN